ncbi:hypothetical protein [Azospirillum endophyticum]
MSTAGLRFHPNGPAALDRGLCLFDRRNCGGHLHGDRPPGRVMRTRLAGMVNRCRAAWSRAVRKIVSNSKEIAGDAEKTPPLTARRRERSRRR